MLINTVLVFLQNILPIFVVISLLFAQRDSSVLICAHEKQHLADLPLSYLFKATGIGLIIVLFLSYFMSGLSQLFSGTGLEIVNSLFFSLIYCCIVISFLHTNVARYKPGQDKERPKDHHFLPQNSVVTLAILVFVLSVHGSYFSLYIMSLTVQNAGVETLYSGIIVGVIIGIGICLSIAILLYFVLVTIVKKTSCQIVCYFLLLFGVGQLIQGIQLLEQVDIISSHVALWDTNYLIAEESELGYFLTILFGYEATPSLIELLVYLCAVTIPIIIAKLLVYKKSARAPFMEGTS